MVITAPLALRAKMVTRASQPTLHPLWPIDFEE
jgi:hypothetical protein